MPAIEAGQLSVHLLQAVQASNLINRCQSISSTAFESGISRSIISLGDGDVETEVVVLSVAAVDAQLDVDLGGPKDVTITVYEDPSQQGFTLLPASVEVVEGASVDTASGAAKNGHFSIEMKNQPNGRSMCNSY